MNSLTFQTRLHFLTCSESPAFPGNLLPDRQCLSIKNKQTYHTQHTTQTKNTTKKPKKPHQKTEKQQQQQTPLHCSVTRFPLTREAKNQHKPPIRNRVTNGLFCSCKTRSVRGAATAGYSPPAKSQALTKEHVNSLHMKDELRAPKAAIRYNYTQKNHMQVRFSST